MKNEQDQNHPLAKPAGKDENQPLRGPSDKNSAAGEDGTVAEVSVEDQQEGHMNNGECGDVLSATGKQA